MVLLIEFIHKECDRQAANVVQFFKDQTRLEQCVNMVRADMQDAAVNISRQQAPAYVMCFTISIVLVFEA